MPPPSNNVVRYLPAAESDLADIYGWILRDSPGRAASFLESMDRRLGALAIHPQLGRAPRHPKLREAGYRVLLIDSYLVFYIVRARVIEIHRVIHGSRSLDDII